MSYEVLARKWRPQVFEDVIGQEHITQTLMNAIKRDRLAHAYLFSGARGVGKTSVARILAKAINCDEGQPGVPCNRCHSCVEITNGSSVDVQEIDGASNRGIDEIRELRENIRYMPASSRSRVYIIDEVHIIQVVVYLYGKSEKIVDFMLACEPDGVILNRKYPMLNIIDRLPVKFIQIMDWMRS